MVERLNRLSLSLNQKRALLGLVRILARQQNESGGISLRINKTLLAKEFNLSPEESAVVGAVLGLVWHHVSKKTKKGGIEPKLKRRFAAVLINNPSGFRQLWEEEHGVEHSRKGRHFPPGRHTSSKRKAVRR